MTEVTWKDLAKTVTDKTKISEEIDEDVKTHTEDLSAHGQANEALYNHRIAEILDHLDYAIAKLKGNFERLDFHWTTLFESIDGYYASGTGTVDLDMERLELRTGSVNGNTFQIRKEPLFPPVTFTFNKNVGIKVPIGIEDVTNQDIRIGVGNVSSDTIRNICFRILNNEVYGRSVKGAGEITETLLQPIAELMGLEFRFTSGEKIEFYINGVLKGTITTNLPTGTFTHPIYAWIKTTTNNDRAVFLSAWDFWQEV